MPDYKNFVLHDGGDLGYGGGYDPAVASYSSVHDGSGGPLVPQVSGCSYDNGTITSTGDALEDSIAGSFAYVVFTGSLSGYTDYYIVATRPDKNTITIVDGPAGTDSCNVTVGGFWPSTGVAFQQALDGFTSESQLHIATDQASGTTIEVETELATNTAVDGGAIYPVMIKGVNKADGSDLNASSSYLPKLQATANLANILKMQSRYYYIKNLYADGNGNAVTIGIGIYNLYVHVVGCLVEDCTNGIATSSSGSGSSIVDCEVWDCDNKGIEAYGHGMLVLNCSVHDCATGIVAQNKYGISVIGCRAFNNSGDGIIYRSYAGGSLLNNVSDNNGMRGFYFIRRRVMWRPTIQRPTTALTAMIIISTILHGFILAIIILITTQAATVRI